MGNRLIIALAFLLMISCSLNAIYLDVNITTKVYSTVVNFPAFIQIPAAICNNSTLINQSNFKNIQFTDTANTVTYPYEFTENCTYYVGGSYANGSTIRIQLGNLGASDQSNATALWNLTNAAMVQHFSSSTGTATIGVDSTLYGVNPATGSPVGVINMTRGKAYNLNGTALILATNLSSLDFGGQWAISLWLRPTSLTGGASYIWEKSDAGLSDSFASIFEFASDAFEMIASGYDIRTSSQYVFPDITNEHSLAFTQNASAGTYFGYHDGVILTNRTSVTGVSVTPALFGIGGRSDGSVASPFQWDEFWIFKEAKTPDYLIALQNQSASFGSVNDTPLPATPNITITQNSPADNARFLNHTLAINYSVNFTVYSNVTAVLYLDGSIVKNTSTLTNTSFAYTATTTYGFHTWYVLAYNTSNIGNNSTSATRTFEIYFNVSNTSPANNSNLSGSTITFQYSTINLYSIQCLLLDSGSQLDNATLASSQNYSIARTVVNNSNTWFASCYGTDNPSYIVNSSAFVFMTTVSTLSNYYVISLTPENVFSTPQSIFYDLNGNLNVFYYTSANSSASAQLRTLTSGVVSNSYSLVNNQTNSFILVARLSSKTLILTFDSLNSTANFFQYDNSTFSVAKAGTAFNAQPNNYYDPFTYAYTKQFSSLGIIPASYYLFILQNGTNTSLVKMNATMNATSTANLSVVSTYAPPFIWKTIANDSNLTTWFYAAPKGTSSFNITIYSYNGTGSTEIATPDATSYPAGNITASKVFFENYGNNTYFMQANVSNNMIYLLNSGGKNVSLGSGITNPSQFFFVDQWTFVFFSTEGSITYAYSCYFEVSGNCTKITASDYGASVPYAAGQLTTSKRVPNILTGPQDVVTNGFISNTNNATALYYNEYVYDLKMRCFDEINLTRKLMNVGIFSNTTAAVMASSTYVYGYVMSNTLLGTGVRQTFSFCPGGTSRMYIYDPNVNPALDTFSLEDTTPNAYYTFLLTNCYSQPIRNALVTARRFLSDRQNFTIIEQAFSSINGDAVLFLEPFITYKINILTPDGVSTDFNFIPATIATNSIPLSCPGSNITVNPDYNSVFADLSYLIKAQNLPPPQGDNKIVTGGSTNQSFNITFNSSSPSGRIFYTNFLVLRTVGDGSTSVVYNDTSYRIFGDNRTFFVNYTTGAAYYTMIMSISILRTNVNNSNGTFDLTNSTDRELVVARAFVRLTAYDSQVTSVRGYLQASFKNGGGWAWIFISTILTMLVVGYVSRFTFDGAGIIGAIIFLSLAIINPVDILIAGSLIPMWSLGAVGLVATLMMVSWRYV